MSKSKKQTFFGIVLSLIMLISICATATFSYAAADSSSDSFYINGNYDKSKKISNPDAIMGYKFQFGNTFKADCVESTISSSNSTYVKAVSKWTSKYVGTTLTTTSTGTKSATAIRKGIVSSATKYTYHEFLVSNSKDSYVFIASGNR